MKTRLGLLTLIAFMAFTLSGCMSAEKIDESIPAGNIATGYPISNFTPPPYPAPDFNMPPSSGPVRENASQMQVEILSIAQSEKSPEHMLLHVRVNIAVPAQGFDEFNPHLAGQEIDILLLAEDAINLAAGDVINLTVSYRGDEWGGGYYGSNVTMQE